uniref:Uncharacterized protein n=1 Tax=Romanomermis culicivorax TaxID=13658 RepID=A0A915IDY7_ROMCU
MEILWRHGIVGDKAAKKRPWNQRFRCCKKSNRVKQELSDISPSIKPKVKLGKRLQAIRAKNVSSPTDPSGPKSNVTFRSAPHCTTRNEPLQPNNGLSKYLNCSLNRPI